MPRTADLRFNQGAVSSRDPTDLRPGEMVSATGVYYKPGDDMRAHKINGRSSFADTGSGVEVKSVHLAQFDTATDLVLGFSGSSVYKSDAGLTGSFSSLIASVTGNRMDVAHANDRHYLVFGGTDQENQVLESDGTVREIMDAPQQAPVAVASEGSVSVTSPDSVSGFDNNANAYDGDLGTFASSAALGEGDSDVLTAAWTGAAISSHKVFCTWSVGPGTGASIESGRLSDTGAALKFGAKYRITFELSEDAGETYTRVGRFKLETTSQRQTFQAEIADSTDLDDVAFKVTIEKTEGGVAVTMRVHDLKVAQDGAETNFSTTTGFYYAVTFYDEDRGLETERSPVTPRVELTDQNMVTLTMPGDTAPSTATHYRIFRTADGGTETQLGLIGSIPIAETTFVDEFLLYGQNDQPERAYPMLPITVGGSTTYYHRDVKPPPLRRITYFKGGLVGLTDESKRELRYSIPGLPESWPRINLIGSFPFPEHDELVDIIEVGGSLICAAKGLMLRLDNLPRSVSGTFIASEAKQIAGAPGCVGDRALTSVPWKGQAHAAWISPDDGILITTGHSYEFISLDIDWDQFEGYDKSKWILHWDRKRRAIVWVYSVSPSGNNSRYALGHLSDVHRKQGGQPKWTFPHYGNISDLTSGQVSNTNRMYSGGFDGVVYLEDNPATGADASNAYDSDGTNRLEIDTGQRYNQWRSWSILDAYLRHSDFGTDETASVQLTTGRDSSQVSTDKSKTVSLAGARKTHFNFGRAGEWHRIKITHDGTGLGSINEMGVNVETMGKEGTAA